MGIDYPSPYLSKFNPNEKDWIGVAFKKSKHVQSAEVNDLQRILVNLMEGSTSKIFSEGQFKGGIKVSSAYVDDDIQVTITAGECYALGIWHKMPTTVVTITGEGKEVISLKLVVTPITSNDDPDLLNPAAGAEAYGVSAADRLTFAKSYVVNDPNAIPVATYQDGQLVVAPNTGNGFLDEVNAILALRTAEKDGSFLAKRPTLSFKDSAATNPQDIQCFIDHGIGYINGIRKVNESSRLLIGRPLEGATRSAEPKIYSTGTKVYSLDKSPVIGITSLLATLQSPSFALTRGATINGSDSIPSQYQPTYQIVSVSDVGHGTYTQGTDYSLGSGVITWLPGGTAPTGGSSYNVVVQYTKVLTKAVRTMTTVSAEAKTVASAAATLAHTDLYKITKIEKSDHSATYTEGTDFTVNKATGVISFTNPGNGTNILVSYIYWAHTVEGDYVSRDSFVTSAGNVQFDSTPVKTPTGVDVNFKSQISFDTSSSFHPVNSSNVYVTYEYALPRRDILVWQEDGLFQIVKGDPSDKPAFPPYSANQMPVAKFYLPAEALASDVLLEFYDNLTLYVTELRDMLHNIRDIQFNLVQFQLESDLSNQPLATNKIGIFADPLETPDLADRTHVDFAGTFDILGKKFTLPRTRRSVSPTFSSTGATKMIDTWIPTFTEEQTISQPFASEARVINKYGSINTRAKVVLSDPFNAQIMPELLSLTTKYTSDHYYIQDVANCYLLANVSPSAPLAAQLGVNTLSTDEPWYISKVATENGWTDAVKNSSGTNPLSNSVVTSETTSVQTNPWATVTRNTKVLIAGNTPAGGEIAVSGSVFGALERYIGCSFNSKPVDITATGATVQEVAAGYTGTVKANSSGVWTGTIPIPSNVKNGINMLEFFGRDPNDLNRTQSYTTATYVATPNLEYVDLTVSIGSLASSSGFGWHFMAPAMAYCNQLGLPLSDANLYYNWWNTGKYAWTSVAHVIAAGIAECVIQGVSLTEESLEDAIAVLAAYTSLNTILRGDQILSIVNAVNLTSTDIEANARAIAAACKFTSFSVFHYQQQFTVDPLAQSFTMFDDRMISSVGIYFNVEPETEQVGVALVEVNDGVPSSHFITQAWKTAASITGSEDASVETKFVFDKPVFAEAGKDYAFVVVTDDNAASIWTAVLGKKDLDDTLITKNPSAGVCYESADAKAWQPISSTDIKFKIYTAKFTDEITYVTTGALDFDPSNLSHTIGQLMFSAPFKELREGTKVTFQYSTDNSTWRDIYPTLDTDLGAEYDTIYCRVKLQNQEYLCPILINSPVIEGYIYSASGAYVHREFSLPSETARYAECYIDTEVPGNTSLAVKFKLDGGAWATASEVTGDRIDISDTVVRRHYTYDAGGSNLFQDVRTKIELSSSVPHVTPSIAKVGVITR